MQILCNGGAARSQLWGRRCGKRPVVRSTAMTRVCVVLALVMIVACESSTPSPAGSSTGTTDAAPVSYAACDDPERGCDDVDCRRVTGAPNADSAWSICMPPCTEDADCPIGAGGNVQVVCSESRCILECVPQVLTCPSGTTCVDGTTPQCMWPD